MPSLYDISDDLLALDALLEESGGEVTPEIEAWLAEYGEALATKVDRTGAYVADCLARVKACKDEEARLAARRATEEHKVARVKAILDGVLLRLGRDKVSGDLFTIARVKNGGVRRLELLCDVEELPEDLRKTTTTTTADIGAIRDRLAELKTDVLASEELGVLASEELGVLAQLAPVGYSVRIK